MRRPSFEWPRPSFWVAFWWPPAICAGLVVFGSLDHGTTRVFPPGGGTGWTTWEEGAARWGAWTFLYGLTAGAMLLAGAVLGRAGGSGLAALAAVPFAAAAYLGRKNWLRLLEERERPRDYELHIAGGLPVVTAAGAAGVVLVLVLAGAWFWRLRRGAGA